MNTDKYYYTQVDPQTDDQKGAYEKRYVLCAEAYCQEDKQIHVQIGIQMEEQ